MLACTMPRANRSIQEGHVYHVTDRCHDRSFLLKFAVDRNAFTRDYAAALEAALDRGGLRREPWWTESIAVGSKEYVLGIAERAKKRMRLKVREAYDGAWTVSDSAPERGDVVDMCLPLPRGQESGPKIERAGGLWCLKRA